MRRHRIGQRRLRSHLRIARIDDAFNQLQRMATFPYEDARVYREMGDIYESHFRKNQMARRMYAKSLQIDPSQIDLTQKLAAGPEMPNAPETPSFDPNSLLPDIPGVPSPTTPTPGTAPPGMTPSVPTP